MISKWVGAVVYKVQAADTLAERALAVDFTSCSGIEQGVNALRSERWSCKLPDPRKVIPRSYGYSEAAGVFVGGVSDPVLAAQSEAIERSVGDALTISMVQLAEDLPDLIFVKGPCFPKVLGRFLSLRLPKSLTVAWLTALSSDNVLPSYVSTLSSVRKVLWDHDDLLNGFTFPEENPKWLIEFVDVGDRLFKIDIIKSFLSTVTRHLPRVMRFCEGIYLPQGEVNYIRGQRKNSRRDVPEWLVNTVPSVVKRSAFAASGPIMFEWDEPE